MDDANIPQATLANAEPSSGEHQSVPTGQLQTITAACAAMKDEIATEAQQMISGTEKIGKQPTFTEACAVMKDQMVDEAKHIVGVLHSSDKLPIEPNGIDSATGVATVVAPIDLPLDSEYPQRKELEQAKRALKEANWFEQ